MTQDTILFDKTLTTPMGDLRVVFDAGNFLDDLDYYQSALMAVRDIPFDLVNIPTSNSILSIASQVYEDLPPDRVTFLIRKYFENETNKANRMGVILTCTKLNPDFDFQPKPYPPARESQGKWDRHLPEIVPDLSYPIEYRLKQLLDMISEDVEVRMNFYSLINTVAVEAERKARQITRDGFRPGHTGRGISPKARAHRVERQASEEPSGVGSVSGRDGDSESQD